MRSRTPVFAPSERPSRGSGLDGLTALEETLAPLSGPFSAIPFACARMEGNLLLDYATDKKARSGTNT